MELKNLKVARWPFFIFHLNYLKRNNDRYKQVQTKYKWPAVLIFIFDKVHIDEILLLIYVQNIIKT